jgi:nitrate/nitrite-specific signal transduction histidine kinase
MHRNIYEDIYEGIEELKKIYKKELEQDIATKTEELSTLLERLRELGDCD